MAKHTPGPWMVGGIYPKGEEDRRAITADDGTKYHRRRTVARVVTPTGYADTHPEIEANAHLIAATPEMYEALKSLIYTASKLWDMVKPIKDSDAVIATHPIIEKAKAALAKAEGGERGCRKPRKYARC